MNTFNVELDICCMIDSSSKNIFNKYKYILKQSLTRIQKHTHPHTQTFKHHHL